MFRRQESEKESSQNPRNQQEAEELKDAETNSSVEKLPQNSECFQKKLGKKKLRLGKREVH